MYCVKPVTKKMLLFIPVSDSQIANTLVKHYSLYSFDKEDEKHLNMFPNLITSKNYTEKNYFQILVVIKLLSFLLYCHLLFDVMDVYTNFDYI